MPLHYFTMEENGQECSHCDSVINIGDKCVCLILWYDDIPDEYMWMVQKNLSFQINISFLFIKNVKIFCRWTNWLR